MKKFLLLFILCLYDLSLLSAGNRDTVYIRETQIPVLIEGQDNVLFQFRLKAQSCRRMDKIRLSFSQDTDVSQIESLKVYYSGTDGIQNEKRTNLFSPVSSLILNKGGQFLSANSSYSVLKDKKFVTSHSIELTVSQSLFPGINYFWISLQMKPNSDLQKTLSCKIDKVIIDGDEALINLVSPANIKHRMAIGVRHAGDDNVAAYRIPGFTTTNKGTLLGVYDVRYNSSKDLQEHIDIGLSRSTDGGKTWEKMRIPLSFGKYGGLPAAQNGVGDPSILVDKNTNTVWIIAAWVHGLGNTAAWFNSGQGMDVNHTAQLVLTKSTDDGRTWSAPINITSQVKKPQWFFLLQGPGRGISMTDGTLVFPIQYIDENRIPHSGIMYSKDSGDHWTIENAARDNTTEAQVAEVSPGVLMLNMRDNRGGSRAVSITKDLGKTWIEHPSSRNALQESVCMASLISVPAKENILHKDILLFSNPNTIKGRHDITVKMSLDGGLTWNKDNQLLLDEGEGWGYSCLTMIDKETIGILYESSVALITFQSIKIKELLNK